MQGADLAIIKDIPGYKIIMKAVLKHQIQQLVSKYLPFTHVHVQGVIKNCGLSSKLYNGLTQLKSLPNEPHHTKMCLPGFSTR